MAVMRKVKKIIIVHNDSFIPCLHMKVNCSNLFATETVPEGYTIRRKKGRVYWNIHFNQCFPKCGCGTLAKCLAQNKAVAFS